MQQVSETAVLPASDSPGAREAQRTASARGSKQQIAAAAATERHQARKQTKEAIQTHGVQVIDRGGETETEGERQRQRVADAIRKVYSIHAPAKVSRVEALLDKYDEPSEWQRLLRLVHAKYE